MSAIGLTRGPRPLTQRRWVDRVAGDDRSAPIRHVDVVLFAATISLIGLGLLFVYSATRKVPTLDSDPSVYLKKQVIAATVGLVAMVVLAVVDLRRIRGATWLWYGIGILALALVISPVGSFAKGAQAWFQVGPVQVQPSEFMKLAVILALAAVACRDGGALSGRGMAACVVVVGLPLALIMLQPDLGTGLVFLMIVLAVTTASGVRARVLVGLVIMGIAVTIAAFNLGVFKQYQIDRFTSFLNPDKGAADVAYNLEQSVAAIGSGGIQGRGLFNGVQNELGYVPEQHTDFIFTVVGEELGFFGGVLTIGLLGVVMWRVWRVAQLAGDLSGTLCCVGVLAMLAFQVFENIGMTMGIMPITGIPLPLVSYGNSALIGTCAALGLVQSIHMRRFQ
jgi:rod shape determining protein RodA